MAKMLADKLKSDLGRLTVSLSLGMRATCMRGRVFAR